MSTKKAKKLPTGFALDISEALFAAANGGLLEAAEGSENEVPTFEIEAYSGGKMTPQYCGIDVISPRLALR